MYVKPFDYSKVFFLKLVDLLLHFPKTRTIFVEATR